MNRLAALICLGALCLGSLCLGTMAAQAQTRFLVLDSERLATEPKALQDLYAEIDALMLQQSVGHNMAMDALEAEFAPVIEAQKTMTEAEYQRALNEFNTSAAQLENALTEAEQGINQATEEALARFNARRTRIEQDVLAKYGALRFIDSASVLYSNPALDLDKTDEVIAELDKVMPTLALERPDTP